MYLNTRTIGFVYCMLPLGMQLHVSDFSIEQNPEVFIKRTLLLAGRIDENTYETLIKEPFLLFIFKVNSKNNIINHIFFHNYSIRLM
jgi:hypothetical protein